MVIAALPAFVTAYAPFMILLMVGYKLKHLRRWVATYAFYRVIQAKADDLGVRRWSFKDIDLTDEGDIVQCYLEPIRLLVPSDVSFLMSSCSF